MKFVARFTEKNDGNRIVEIVEGDSKVSKHFYAESLPRVIMLDNGEIIWSNDIPNFEVPRVGKSFFKIQQIPIEFCRKILVSPNDDEIFIYKPGYPDTSDREPDLIIKYEDIKDKWANFEI